MANSDVDPADWTDEKKREELTYMLNTIKSSWEFVDYVFQIEGVSRAFTHQFVRHRTGSYAQQSHRVTDQSDFEFIYPDFEEEEQKIILDATLDEIRYGYKYLVGESIERARSILPTNVATNITAKFNLRTLHEMAKIRLCWRTQGEFQRVFREMRARVLEVHPWAEPFIRVHCAATGTCAFPRHEGCPIKGGVFNPDSGIRHDEEYYDYYPSQPNTRDELQILWENAW